MRISDWSSDVCSSDLTDSWNGVLRDFTTDRVVRRYTDFLPSVNAVFDLSEGDKVRLSAARLVARQQLVSLGQGFATQFTRDPADALSTFTHGSRRNADLHPFRAAPFPPGSYNYSGNQGLPSPGLSYTGATHPPANH